MSGLRVAIDGRPLVGNRTGIGVHTAAIAARLGLDHEPVIASHAEIEDRSGLDRCRLLVDPASIGVLWQQLILPRVVDREQSDVLWGPHGTIPLALRVPAVTSVHDLTSITMPHRHRLKTILSFNTFIRPSLERAARIAAVSRTAADEIIRGFGISSAKIEVVPNGVDPFFSPGKAEREDFILYVGTLEPRKGITELLDAWLQLTHRPRLILAGDAGWGTSSMLRKVRDRIDDGSIEVRGFIDRVELRDLFRRCSLFVYPSHFEGFGLPPLEAMACGAPVITTTGGAIPEVVGDAACLVSPGDRHELHSAIRGLLRNEQHRAQLSAAGIERAGLFDWDTSAEAMRGLLLEAAEEI